MRFKTAIALSGGVDSLVAAYLLKEKGHDLFGLHFKTGFESETITPEEDGLSAPKASIHDIGKQLGIPVHTIDCSQKFKTEVVDYFVKSYQNARTPNPCMVCNPRIKFGIVLEAALKMGASRLATGHYAKVRKNGEGSFQLLKGADPLKDQSYFLSRLSQAQLGRTLFPLGDYTKPAVIELARKKKLNPISAKESQDICFLPQRSYATFLKSQPGFTAKEGPITDTHGEVIGRHRGLHLFTIGQRRGINCPASEPYYVTNIDPEQNRLIVGFENELKKNCCHVEDINWLIKPPTGAVNVKTQIRYRSKAVQSKLILNTASKAVIYFKTPQKGITPGQGAVFYKGAQIIGSGWITEDPL